MIMLYLVGTKRSLSLINSSNIPLFLIKLALNARLNNDGPFYFGRKQAEI